MSTPHQLAVAMLSGVAAGWAGRFQPDLSREEALDQIRAISGDVEALADAAAMYATADLSVEPWAPDALQLLLDAGADPEAVERYAEARRKRKRGRFGLGAFAEGINKLDSAHG